jgi:hypothetical protein
MIFKVLLSAIVFLSVCATFQSPPAPTPNPPSGLLNLPADGPVRCYNDPNLDKGGITVWEKPGLPSPDPDSNISGYKGLDLGAMRHCSIVRVADYAWSETDQKFYVYIKSDNSEDWVYTRVTPLEGWISFDLITLDP